MANEPENHRKLPGREDIEAYINQRGLISLKQDNYSGDPSVIQMLPTDVPIIIQWLQELVKEHAEIE